MTVDLRCRSCGALLAEDATWCGQCYAPLGERDERPASDPSSAPAPPAAVPGAPPAWPCSVCGSRNPIDADACQACGTPFAVLMRDEPDRAPVDPGEATRRSLLFPGLGHRLLGRPMDGLARGALFGVSLLMAVLLGATGLGSGVAVMVFALFLVTAVGTYVLTAVEAGRLARGGDVIVPARTLMWVVTGEVFLAVIVLAISVVSATRR